MLDKKNVLVFPAGSQNGLDIYRAIKNNIHFSVFGLSGIDDHARFIYEKNHIEISKKYYISNENFLNHLNELITRWNISFIIPTHDSIAVYLLKNAVYINATIVCSPLETTLIAEDKSKMFDELKNESYFPNVYKVDSEEIHFPVFLKPNISAGGKGTCLINNRTELNATINSTINKDYLLYEYLPGKEITVDCFTDKNGDLLFVGPRTRERITQGISYRSRRVETNDEIFEIANSLNRHFTFRGLWYFQLKEDSTGHYKFMEFSVRHAGTMSFYRQLGVNFPLLSLFDFMGYNVSIMVNDFNLILDRAIETKYLIDYNYNVIYVDFDDTIIVNNKVNLELIKFLYSSLNNNKRIILLTKHEKDITNSLLKYKICREIFSEIIIIDPNKQKYEYIDTIDAIFIDNYFPERQSVYKHCHIPVFDVDAIECLI